MDQWEKINAPLDAPFPAQGRRKEHIEREEELPNDIAAQVQEHEKIDKETAALQ